jgi:peroxiredoxin
MYLHLGKETVITFDNIVGIFDLDNTTISKTTREYLNKAEKEKEVITVSTELPKSFIVCCEKEKKQKIYISQISSTTLLKRTGFVEGLSNIQPLSQS